MRTICYHHVDADGILSAALVNYYVKGEKKFIKSSYGMEINWEDIGLDDTVYIVDFSFSPHDMDKLCLVAENVIWIDHHVSAINDWEAHLKSMREKFPGYKDVDGLRKVGVAGCQLTEQFFYNLPNKNSINHRINKPWTKGSDCSELVETIGTYDVWNKENPNVSFDRAYKCMLGLIAKYNNPEDPFFTGYFLEPHPWSMVEDLVDYGSVVQSYLENFQNEKINKNAFETKLFGKKAIVVNTPLKGSGPLIDIYNNGNYDIMCVFFFNGKYWEYSFYTEKENINCAYICKNLAKDDTKIGGGHKKAAGCSLTYNLFSNGFSTFGNIDKVE
jgi:oligoribonuclease NrnB/cAMP/cGMP phosphodiesterase (DHH superfamily)